jgi:nitroreductase
MPRAADNGQGADPGTVQAALVAALRAPSAHNAQPWRLSPERDGGYRLWYAYADKLLADPDDRDGLLAVGGYLETLRLAAEDRGLEVEFVEAVTAHDLGIDVGTVRFAPLTRVPDPLAAAIAQRQCNRFPFARQPLPPGIVAELEALGHVLVPSADLADLVSQASVLSWRDRRFVTDLARWTRFEAVAPDGMTFDCLRLDRFDVLALRLALALGRLPGWLAWIYAQRDVRLTRASSQMAILTVPDRSPSTLVDAGRRLIRSWTLLNSLGYGWQPMSVVIDQPTVDTLRERIGGLDPVAIYRVGYPPEMAPWSQRRSIEQVVVPLQEDQALGTM